MVKKLMVSLSIELLCKSRLLKQIMAICDYALAVDNVINVTKLLSSTLRSVRAAKYH